MSVITIYFEFSLSSMLCYGLILGKLFHSLVHCPLPHLRPSKSMSCLERSPQVFLPLCPSFIQPPPNLYKPTTLNHPHFYAQTVINCPAHISSQYHHQGWKDGKVLCQQHIEFVKVAQLYPSILLHTAIYMLCALFGNPFSVGCFFIIFFQYRISEAKRLWQFSHINSHYKTSIKHNSSVLVAQLVERPPGSPMCSQKECPTKFETRWLQEIPFSKELTDNYCALGLLFESITCNNNNNNNWYRYM